MGPNDVIFPGTPRLFFDLELTGTNTKRAVVSNIGKSIVRDLRIPLEGTEIQSISDYNIFPVYKDLWLPKVEREYELILEGINSNDGTIRAMQVNPSDHVGTDEEKGIVAAYGKTF